MKWSISKQVENISFLSGNQGFRMFHNAFFPLWFLLASIKQFIQISWPWTWDMHLQGIFDHDKSMTSIEHINNNHITHHWVPSDQTVTFINTSSKTSSLENFMRSAVKPWSPKNQLAAKKQLHREVLHNLAIRVNENLLQSSPLAANVGNVRNTLNHTHDNEFTPLSGSCIPVLVWDVPLKHHAISHANMIANSRLTWGRSRHEVFQFHAKHFLNSIYSIFSHHNSLKTMGLNKTNICWTARFLVVHALWRTLGLAKPTRARVWSPQQQNCISKQLKLGGGMKLSRPGD